VGDSDNRQIRLAVPATIRRLGPRAILRWQVDPGQKIRPHDPIARLDGKGGEVALVLQAPEDCYGIILACWVEDGAEVIVGEPVLTLRAEQPGSADTWSGRESFQLSEQAPGLSERAQAEYEPDLPGLSQAEPGESPFDALQGVSARHLSRHDRVGLAVVGAVSLLGLLIAAIGLVACIVLRTGAPALVVALSLAVVAGSLSYGKDRMDRIGG